MNVLLKLQFPQQAWISGLVEPLSVLQDILCSLQFGNSYCVNGHTRIIESYCFHQCSRNQTKLQDLQDKYVGHIYILWCCLQRWFKMFFYLINVSKLG